MKTISGGPILLEQHDFFFGDNWTQATKREKGHLWSCYLRPTPNILLQMVGCIAANSNKSTLSFQQ